MGRSRSTALVAAKGIARAKEKLIGIESNGSKGSPERSEWYTRRILEIMANHGSGVDESRVKATARRSRR